MIIDPSKMGAEACYRLLTGLVVPRPIAWVTSLSDAGVLNLAPFSAFTFVSPKPPMLAISVGHKNGHYKDTARNILSREEYVVHIADQTQLDALHASAEEHPADVSEVALLGLATADSDLVGPARLADAPVAMECRLRHCIEFGETRSRLLVGEVVRIHAREGLVRDGKVDTLVLDPVARIGGPTYATLGRLVTKRAVQQTPKS